MPEQPELVGRGDRLRARVRQFRGRSRRSVVFIHHSYYHFFYLAQALRARGWDALTVSIEPADGPNAGFYHGEDINLWDPDDARMQERLRVFFRSALGRFRLVHFAGDGTLSLFPGMWQSDEPEDLCLFRRYGARIAHTVSGCSSGIAQASIRRWSTPSPAGPVCSRCVWELRPDVCSDEKNLAWGRKYTENCDIIFAETLPALDFTIGSGVVRDPVTMCLDPEVWRPDLPVPPERTVPRLSGEFLVYHAVGNFQTRSVGGRNIKGTQAVVDAVERLCAEGIRTRLIFAHDLPNLEVRYLQVQSDVVVDQLNFGRYGATAREAMMLGRPTICYMNPTEEPPAEPLSCMADLPLVSATEATVYDVLKGLLLDGGRRKELGERGRAYALAYHGKERCAEKYELLYDELLGGAA